MLKPEARVRLRNISTGVTLNATVENGHYSAAFVDFAHLRPMRVGDVLEISAEVAAPDVVIQPLRYAISINDIRRRKLLLPDLAAQKRPRRTQLHPNYPNPFNPETWMPYQLAKPATVTIDIYDVSGALMRTLNLGHRTEGFYLSRSRAAYWDGTNSTGEQMASGVYFYRLNAGEYSATRNLAILK